MAGKLGRWVNRLMSWFPVDLWLQAWNSWTCRYRRSSIHPRKTERPHSSALMVGRQQEEGHKGGGRAWFHSNGNESLLLFSKPMSRLCCSQLSWVAATVGAWVGKCWEALEMHWALLRNTLISVCVCMSIGFYCTSARSSSLPIAIEVIFTLCSGNADVLHQKIKFYRDTSTGPSKSSLKDATWLTWRPRRG